MPQNLALLIRRIFLILIFYSVSRLLFFLFNLSYFHEADIGEIIACFISGIRFDITAIIISNLLFIILHINPFSFFYHRLYQLFLKILFIVINSFFILLNFIDFILFRFTGRRASSDTLRIMGFGEDFVNTLPHMIADFWYLALLFVLLVIVMLRFYNSIKIRNVEIRRITIWNSFMAHVITIALIVIGFRGGIQYRPISILTASMYGSPKMTALILNTPFSVIKSFGKNDLAELHYFSDVEAEGISPTNHQFNHNLSFRKLNVMIIILEGFGKEYIGSLNHYEGYTPFLDSLIKQSLVFPKAYANGKRSIEGIPAIVAGIPALMSEPFITSGYNGNEISGLAKLLKEEGYSTVFYHGGTNGTMGFDNFSKAAGYERYIGREEYNNDVDFDGNWGIYDEPFMQFTANDLNKTKEPFFATLFTISSHHPYAIPKQYNGKFKKGTLPLHESVMYADYSLKKFFETSSKMPWFDSTLFVITADHTALSESPFYQTRAGIYSIPVLYYMHNSTLNGFSEITTQQIDILPSILDYLGYQKKIFAFGKSVFDTTDHFAVNFLGDIYQIITDHYSLSMDNDHPISLYNFKIDSLFQNNLISVDTLTSRTLERKLKAFTQNFNNAMIHSTMVVK